MSQATVSRGGVPIATITRSGQTVTATPVETCTATPGPGQGPVTVQVTKNSFMFYGLIFLISGVVAFLLFYVFKPTIVQKTRDKPLENESKTTGEVDAVKALVGAIIVAFIITALVYIVKVQW